MIVIDTSAFTKFLMREKNWQDVVQYIEPKAQPHTVEMLFTESTNVIWKYVKKTLISKEEGFDFVVEYDGVSIKKVATSIESLRKQG